MTCGKKHCNNAPTEATRVDPAEVEGRPLCDHADCDLRVVGDGSKCADGHVQRRPAQASPTPEQSAAPATLPGVARALEEWRRHHRPGPGEAGYGVAPRLAQYNEELRLAEERGEIGSTGSRQHYGDLGAYRLREAVEFLEQQGEPWAADPRVQAARAFIEETRQARSLSEIMAMERKAQTAALRELVDKADAVDVPDIVAALVERQRSGGLLRALQERYPELVTEELLGVAQFLARDSQPLDAARLADIAGQLTESERGYLLERGGGLAPARFGAVVAAVAPQLEQPETALATIQRYDRFGMWDAAAQSSGQAQALAALAPYLGNCHVEPVVVLLESGTWTDPAGKKAVGEVLMQMAPHVPAELVYRTVEVARLVSDGEWHFMTEWPRRLARADIAEELLFAVQQNGRADDYLRSALLRATYPHLQEAHHWRRAWRTVSTLRRGEDAAWAELAAVLPPNLMGELLPDLPANLVPQTRLEICAALAPRCPAEHWAALMAQMGKLAAPYDHTERKTMAAVCTATPSDGWRATLHAVEQIGQTVRGGGAPLLAEFIAQVPAPHVEAACGLALRLADDVGAATRIFEQLGPRLSSEQAAHVVRTAWREYEQMEAQDQVQARGAYTPPRGYEDRERGNVLVHSVLSPALAAQLPPEAMAEAFSLLGYTPRYNEALLAMVPRLPAAMLPQAADRARLSARRYYANDAAYELAQKVRAAVRARAQELRVDLAGAAAQEESQ